MFETTYARYRDRLEQLRRRRPATMIEEEEVRMGARFEVLAQQDLPLVSPRSAGAAAAVSGGAQNIALDSDGFTDGMREGIVAPALNCVRDWIRDWRALEADIELEINRIETDRSYDKRRKEILESLRTGQATADQMLNHGPDTAQARQELAEAENRYRTLLVQNRDVPPKNFPYSLYFVGLATFFVGEVFYNFQILLEIFRALPALLVTVFGVAVLGYTCHIIGAHLKENQHSLWRLISIPSMSRRLLMGAAAVVSVAFILGLAWLRFEQILDDRPDGIEQQSGLNLPTGPASTVDSDATQAPPDYGRALKYSFFLVLINFGAMILGIAWADWFHEETPELRSAWHDLKKKRRRLNRADPAIREMISDVRERQARKLAELDREREGSRQYVRGLRELLEDSRSLPTHERMVGEAQNVLEGLLHTYKNSLMIILRDRFRAGSPVAFVFPDGRNFSEAQYRVQRLVFPADEITALFNGTD